MKTERMWTWRLFFYTGQYHFHVKICRRNLDNAFYSINGIGNLESIYVYCNIPVQCSVHLQCQFLVLGPYHLYN